MRCIARCAFDVVEDPNCERLQAARILIDAGANIAVTDHTGETLLYYAASSVLGYVEELHVL
jgi:hypothetical protein